MTRTKPLATAIAALAGAVAVALLWPSAPGASTPPTPARTTTGPVVLNLSGTRSIAAPTFVTGPDWTVHYTYSGCTGAPFTVTERGGAQDGIALAQGTDSANIGTMYVHGVPGVHRLQIAAHCSWTVTVTDGETLPRATGGAS